MAVSSEEVQELQKLRQKMEDGETVAEVDPEEAEKAADAEKELRRTIRKSMAGKGGRKLLKVLRERTTDVPPLKTPKIPIGMEESCDTPMTSEQYVYWREGQNSITRWIERMIEEDFDVK